MGLKETKSVSKKTLHRLIVLTTSSDFLLTLLSGFSLGFFQLWSSALGWRTLNLEFCFSFEKNWCTLYRDVSKWDCMCKQLLSVLIVMKDVHHFSGLMQKPTLFSSLAFQHHCSLHFFQCPSAVHTNVVNFVLQKSASSVPNLCGAFVIACHFSNTSASLSFCTKLALYKSRKDIRFYFRSWSLYSWETNNSLWRVHGTDTEQHMKITFY